MYKHFYSFFSFNHFYVLAILGCILFSCKAARKEDCKLYKTGRFAMTAGDKQYEINRNDSIQTEFEKETGNLATFNIKWNDDCSYTLTLVGDNFGLKDQAGDNTTLNFDIIEATKSYYIFRQEFSFMDAGNIDTIWRARN